MRMNLTTKQCNLLERQQVVVLATASLAGVPRAIFVEINQAAEDQIIITDNEMGRTRKNLLENPCVFLLAFEEDYSYCLKISGEAQYVTRGKYFDFVKGLESNKDYSPKGAVVVRIREVVELR